MTTFPRNTFVEHVRRYATFHGVLALAAIFRFLHLGERSLSLDECIIVEVVRSSWDRLIEVTNQIHSASPLFPALSKAALAILPESETTFRFLPALFGLMAVTALMLAAWSRDRAMALFSGLFLACATQHLWLSRDYNGYSLLVMSAAACFWLYLRLEDTPQVLSLLVVMEIVAVWAHYQGIFTVGGLQLTYLLEKWLRHRPLPTFRRWIAWHLVALAGVLAVLPVSLLAQWHNNPRGTTYLASQYFSLSHMGIIAFFKQNIREFLDACFAPHSAFSAHAYAVFVGAATVLLLLRLIRRSSTTSDHGFPVKTLACLLVGAGSFYFPFVLAGLYPFGGIRHSVFLTLPVYLLCGWFLARLPRTAAIGLLCAACFFYVPATRAHFALTLYGGEHIRPLVQRLNATDDSRPVLVYSGAIRAFRYYNTKRNMEIQELSVGDIRKNGMAEILAQLERGDSWVIASHFQGNHRELLDQAFSSPPRSLMGRWEEPGAVLWLVRNAPAEMPMQVIGETPETRPGGPF